MSTVYANVMVKNEEILLKHVLPIWEKYPIEKFVFLNDASTDNTVDVIKHFLGERSHIIDRKTDKFHEAKNRSSMLEWSRDKCDFVLAIDADELVSSNMIDHWNDVLNVCKVYDLKMYWYNNVYCLSKIRQDPAYASNFRTFILNTKTCGQFDLSGERYHTPRTPENNLPVVATKDLGILHLQAINVKHYVLKQLWYKHFESKNYGYSADLINQKYDCVVNNLNFHEIEIHENLIKDIKFDPNIFNQISEKKGYKDYILNNVNQELITFGKEYLEIE